MLVSPSKFDQRTSQATTWIGSKSSIIIHTILFIACFALVGFGVSTEKVLLILTTAVSLEAIYLSIFIQYSVNQQARTLKDVAEDIEEVTEDVDELSEDVNELSEEVEDISENLEVKPALTNVKISADAYEALERKIKNLIVDMEDLKANSLVNETTSEPKN